MAKLHADTGFRDEFFIGLCSAIGTDDSPIIGNLEKSLRKIGYAVNVIKLSKILHKISPWQNLPLTRSIRYYQEHMDAGNEFRKRTRIEAALALLAITAVWEKRKGSGKPAPNQAYVFDSLKHPGEVDALRFIYGDSFCLLSVYQSMEERQENLTRQIKAKGKGSSSNLEQDVLKLVVRDSSEAENRFGQNVRDTFPLADLFVDLKLNPEAEIERFLKLMFGYPYHTPSRDEYSMYVAQAVAARSAALSRQVGAVIATPQGDIIAVGSNEVPKAFGGLYWEGDPNDQRDFQRGRDPSDSGKRLMLSDMFVRLKREGWLDSRQSYKSADRLAKEALSPGGVLRRSELIGQVALDRTVHAEMAAITDSSRRTIPIIGCYLYTTTFPCHNCAKHIVASGITKCFYIEPYPKSKALELHDDSIVHRRTKKNDERVDFRPFIGVAPRRYFQLFTWGNRKKEDGTVLDWKAGKAKLKYRSFALHYLDNETYYLKKLQESLNNAKLTIS